ncbi:uncharacterized protein LOC131650843 [Vicia villosa]|uniref:uncharacterized protein LOC131650843 n=1 Tax=Vicia villosa TaxID=3911 RepID=UPI00273CAF51|nr:uncharacterized protein LOC131650843 [Vicia villosa]
MEFCLSVPHMLETWFGYRGNNDKLDEPHPNLWSAWNWTDGATGELRGIAAIYASTCHIKRRALWDNLSSINSVNIPWSFVGDFNVILGAHEHRGSCLPYMTPINEFKDWVDNNNLLEIPSKGSFYTWFNGRDGGASVERKLDRAFDNNNWCNASVTMGVVVLPKYRSDHHPLLVDCDFNSSQHKASFRFFAMWTLNDSCSNLISDYWSINHVGYPMWILAKKLQHLKKSLKHWNWKVFGNVHKKSSFLRVIWTLSNNRFVLEGDQPITDNNRMADIAVNFFTNLFGSAGSLHDLSLVEEVIPALVTPSMNSIMTILPSHDEIRNAHGWIIPNYNVSKIILIPKSPEAHSMDIYRPIALSNFKFKIITKIIAVRLSSILPILISKEQRGFVHGRNIRDCICLASEAVNVLDNKSTFGNIALKVDISKAFDTISWEFIIKVLKCFSFCDTFCSWIKTLLSLAAVSICFNGNLHCFFNCARGVRRDPLSPLLFCLAEEVLSRCIYKAVRNGDLELIKASRNNWVPSHITYADDIMLFCSGRFSNVKTLKDIFSFYATISGQCINTAKSFLYSGAVSNRRMDCILASTGFQLGSVPFSYLGVPLFKGRVKNFHIAPIVDRILSKMASWK